MRMTNIKTKTKNYQYLTVTTSCTEYIIDGVLTELYLTESLTVVIIDGSL
jgi:hypothetical protein